MLTKVALKALLKKAGYQQDEAGLWIVGDYLLELGKEITIYSFEGDVETITYWQFTKRLKQDYKMKKGGKI
jgi:hypothetical protein